MRVNHITKRIANIFCNEEITGFKVKQVSARSDGFGSYKFWILSDYFEGKTIFESLSIAHDILLRHTSEEDRRKIWAISIHYDKNEMHANIDQWKRARYLPE